jgi:hypothetical protein
MAKKFNARTWARQLPKPIRNGRFYRLGHHVAVVLAGHAHQDGTGITVALKTLAEESWCTLNEIAEAVEWLEQEKWFTRSDGPRGAEWSCNFELTRDGASEIEARLEHRRALGRARWHRHQEAKKSSGSVSEARESTLVGCVSEDEQLTHPTNELTQDTNATNAPNKRSALVGGVRTAGHNPEELLKNQEEPEEPKKRSAAADAPLALIDPPTKAKPAKTSKPEQVLTRRYYDAMEGNINFLAVQGVIKKALAKYPVAEVQVGVDCLGENPGTPFIAATLWNAMCGRIGGKRQHKPFQSVDHDYTDHGGFGA